MAEKKYYWLKLQKDFFKRHDIKIIEAMPNGKDYVLFYLKMLVESIDHDGMLRFNDTIPYNEGMLATITNTNVDVVRAAMKVFEQLSMIEIMDDKTIFMAESQRMLGCETSVAERVRRSREKQKALQCNTHVTPSNETKQKSNTEKELEKEIELEIDIELERKKRKDVFSTHTLSSALESKIKEWLSYKSERRESYKKTGLKSLLTQIENKAKEHGDDAVIKLIDVCMANNWKGIIWDKLIKPPEDNNYRKKTVAEKTFTTQKEPTGELEDWEKQWIEEKKRNQERRKRKENDG